MYFYYRKPKSNAEPHTEEENNKEAEEDGAYISYFIRPMKIMGGFFYFVIQRTYLKYNK